MISSDVISNVNEIYENCRTLEKAEAIKKITLLVDNILRIKCQECEKLINE